MTFYKYVPPQRVDILEKNCILFSPPALFNDPFEMRPLFDAVEDPSNAAAKWAVGKNSIPFLLNHIHNRYDELSPDERAATNFDDFMKNFVSSSHTTDPSSISEIVRLEVKASVRALNADPLTANNMLREALNEAVGVLSLTKTKDNLLMWAHYAQSHTGFVIELDETNDFFHQQRSATDQFGYAREVVYSETRPTNLLLVNAPFETIYLVKSERDWKYEQEWRVLRSLEDANGSVKIDITDEDSGTIRSYPTFHLPPECITGIIMGCRMSETCKRKIGNILKGTREYSHTKLQAASIAETRFSINIEDI